ncbi:phage terminase small subunit P27 family [Schleiferilactobacillus harbinensis]|uniref:phage terminase small subunit P27 family n=1 Tax=Schleiferilactobacillus harbinensis TaxID=304207 RepID=UPI0007B9A705|nr:phage terminase small subunit P27 family [Schleiferilactobacillus harbinensis]
MVGRKPKITTSDDDRADQRRRTEQLIDKTKDLNMLQTRAPKHLSGVARSTWESLVPQLNAQHLVKAIDKNVMTALCEQVQVERWAYEAIEANGVVLDSGRKNPACQVLDSATAKVKSLAESLGLSPAARASLINVETSDDDESTEDIASKLMKKGDEQF